MTEAQAHKQAALESKTQGARYVVYVCDQGQDVFNREQVRRYGELVFVEALYVDGLKVADSSIATGIAQLGA